MRSTTPDDDWLDWCRQNRSWLAAEFLRTVDGGDSVRSFFGSWYDLRGRKQTGYYLGHEVISCLAGTMTQLEIARLTGGPELESTIRGILRELALDSE